MYAKPHGLGFGHCLVRITLAVKVVSSSRLFASFSRGTDSVYRYTSRHPSNIGPDFFLGYRVATPCLDDRQFKQEELEIDSTSEFWQYCHVRNTAQQCRMGFFQDSAFAGNLEASNSTSWRILCIFGSRTSVPISWMCKRQTAVSQGSTESGVISLDAGLDLWVLVFEVLLSSCNHARSPGDWSRNKHCEKQSNS